MSLFDININHLINGKKRNIIFKYKNNILYYIKII